VPATASGQLQRLVGRRQSSGLDVSRPWMTSRAPPPSGWSDPYADAVGARPPGFGRPLWGFGRTQLCAIQTASRAITVGDQGRTVLTHPPTRRPVRFLSCLSDRTTQNRHVSGVK
jgi:hypothetical protein